MVFGWGNSCGFQLKWRVELLTSRFLFSWLGRIMSCSFSVNLRHSVLLAAISRSVAYASIPWSFKNFATLML